MKTSRVIFVDARDWLRVFDAWYPVYSAWPRHPNARLAYLIIHSLGCGDQRYSPRLRHYPRHLRHRVATGAVRPRLRPSFLNQIDHYLQTKGI